MSKGMRAGCSFLTSNCSLRTLFSGCFSCATLPSRGAAVLRPFKDYRSLLRADANQFPALRRTARNARLRQAGLSHINRSVACFALLARRFKLVAGLPALQLRCHGRLLAQQKSKSRHLGESGEIHLWMILIAGLMIAMIDVIFRLGLAPRGVVAGVLQSFADGKGGHADAREAEMVRAVIVSRLWMRIRANRQAKCLCQRFYHRIKRGALRPADIHLLWIANRSQRIIIQVHGNFRGGDRRMLA